MGALERRLRRLTFTVTLFSVAAAAFGMFPHGVDVYDHSYKHDTDTFDHWTNAGGWSLIVWAAAHVLAGHWVREQPERISGVRRLVAEVLIYTTSGVAWLIEHFTLSPTRLEWPGQLTAAFVGATTLLVFVALPAVLLVTKRSPPSGPPTARVVT